MNMEGYLASFASGTDPSDMNVGKEIRTCPDCGDRNLGYWMEKVGVGFWWCKNCHVGSPPRDTIIYIGHNIYCPNCGEFDEDVEPDKRYNFKGRDYDLTWREVHTCSECGWHYEYESGNS